MCLNGLFNISKVKFKVQNVNVQKERYREDFYRMLHSGLKKFHRIPSQK